MRQSVSRVIFSGIILYKMIYFFVLSMRNPKKYLHDRFGIGFGT